MTHARHPDAVRPWTLAARLALLAGAALLLGGCNALNNALKPSSLPQPSFYTLETRSVPASPAPQPRADAPTLLVRQPRAAAGYDSQRIIYTREAHRLEYFAHNEWVDPPARMLGPLLVDALRASGAWRAVALAPGVGMGDLQLETQILRLEQDFQTRPSQVRFALRATLVEERTRRIAATRDFEASVPAPADNPAGGVQAANRAVQQVLDELARFCAEHARIPTTP